MDEINKKICEPLQLEEELKIPTWNPSEHAFVGTIQEYTPKKRLLYTYQPDIKEPFVLLFSFLIIGGLIGVYFEAILQGIIGGFFLIGFYILFQWKIGKYSPIVWDFDFEEKFLCKTRKGDIDNEEEYDLNEVESVILCHEHTQHKRNQKDSFGNYTNYNGRTLLRGIGPNDQLAIAQTGEVREDPENTYYDGLAFANMLAVELYVPIEIKQTKDGQEYQDNTDSCQTT